jgi:hypothetical protein
MKLIELCRYTLRQSLWDCEINHNPFITMEDIIKEVKEWKYKQY